MIAPRQVEQSTEISEETNEYAASALSLRREVEACRCLIAQYTVVYLIRDKREEEKEEEKEEEALARCL